MATPNMNLTLPVVGVTAGPAYATQINAALTVLDGHNHSPGSGVQITPAGLNINTDLTLQSNDLIDARTVRFTAQPAAITGASPDLGCLYVVNDDLYYNDGLGNQIAITTAGSIAGAAGNITGLVSPASVTYTSGGAPNYKFMSSATVSANLDAASLLIRNPGVTATYALTLQAPTLASNFSLTLPQPPASASFLQIDSSGIITAAPTVALGITSSMLAADSVATAKIVDLNVTGAKIANATIASSKLSFSPTLAATTYFASTSIVVPAGINAIIVSGVGAGGGGGAGASGASSGGGGGGASGHALQGTLFGVTPGETLTLVIAAGGAGGSSVGVGGTTANLSSVSGSFGDVFLWGGAGGSPGSGSSGGAGGVSQTIGGSTSAPGGAGGAGASPAPGAAGSNSIRVSGTPGMAAGSTGGGGGGGGGIIGSTSNPAGNDGKAAPASSGTGGQGGAGNQLGGNGGSAQISITYVPLV